MLEGCAGTGFTVTASILAVPLPQLLLGVTVIVPDVALEAMVAVTLAVLPENVKPVPE
jgi:ABC-type antimicrobial peptide transport system permease subunit